MKQHKWHKEIIAWANGAEIEVKHIAENEWENFEGDWSLTEGYEFRIKSQFKESRIVREMKEAMEDLRKSLGKEPQEMINGLTEEETNNTMSVKGLSQPKEPQYLYVYTHPQNSSFMLVDNYYVSKYYIGKIKLEVEDETN